MSQNLNLELTESESALLRSTAGQFGVTPQQLARTAIVDALNRLRNDEQFAGIVKETLAKNEGLYNRLAK